MHALPWLLAVVLSDLSVPTTSEVRRPPEWLTPSLVVAGSVLGLAEVVSSEQCLSHRTCVEANPMMPGGRGTGDTAARLMIKSAGTATVAYLLLKYRHRHPWAMVAGSLGLVVWNGYLTSRALDHAPPRRLR